MLKCFFVQFSSLTENLENPKQTIEMSYFSAETSNLYFSTVYICWLWRLVLSKRQNEYMGIIA